MSSALAPPRGSGMQAAPAAATHRPARPPVRWSGWPDVIGGLTALSLVVVAALWILGGGLTGVGSLATAMTSLGRITGLLASDLLLIQVLLMARIPVVEATYGQDELAIRHRLVGFTSFTLMVAHILLIVIGYAGARIGALWPTFVNIVLEDPGMLLALAGTLAIIAVTVTSIRRSRARLRYESWHLLHLYAYLGAGLALPHQLWTGTSMLTSAAATAYWWSLWGVAAASILAFRVVLPVWRSRRHALVVADVRHESATATTVTMAGRDLDRLPVRASQFFQWRFLDGPGWSRAHPYSLSAAPDGRSLRITVDGTGDGAQRVAALRPGTRVLVEGPYGRLHDGVRTRQGVVLIAAGIGIAPMVALLEGMDQRPGDVTVIYRVHETATAVLLDELTQRCRERAARLVVIPGARMRERASWLPQTAAHLSDGGALLELLPGIAEQDVYVCGSTPWMSSVEQALLSAGVPAGQIHIERFSY